MAEYVQPSISASGSDLDQAPPAPPLTGAQKFVWVVSNFEEIVSALLLGVMLASVGVSVFCRYVLQSPLSWTEEVVLMCMVWMVLLGASIATKHREHIVIDFVISLVPRGLARVMEIASVLVVLAVLATMVSQGIVLVQRTQFVTTTALGIPTMYMYAAVPFSALLMIVHNLRLLFDLVRKG